MAGKKIKQLADLTPQVRNANRGTERGRGMLERSMGEVGFLGAMTVAADGEVFAGSKRLEVAGEVFSDVEPIVVESDGTRPIVVVRTDIPNADDPRAVRAGILDNRVAEVSMDWDPAVFAALAAEHPEALAGLWSDAESAAILGGGLVDDDPLDGVNMDDRYTSQYGVVVVCDTEAEQETVYNRLLGEGYNCRVVVT